MPKTWSGFKIHCRFPQTSIILQSPGFFNQAQEKRVNSPLMEKRYRAIPFRWWTTTPVAALGRSPHRRGDICCLTYGVAVPRNEREPNTNQNNNKHMKRTYLRQTNFKPANGIPAGLALAVVLAGSLLHQDATAATLGAGSHFEGSILASDSITLNTGAELTGRALSQVGAVTLDYNTLQVPEAGSTLLLGAGLMNLLFRRRRLPCQSS